MLTQIIGESSNDVPNVLYETFRTSSDDSPMLNYCPNQIKLKCHLTTPRDFWPVFNFLLVKKCPRDSIFVSIVTLSSKWSKSKNLEDLVGGGQNIVKMQVDLLLSSQSVDCGSYKLYPCVCLSVCLSVPLLQLISRLLWVGFSSNLVKMLGLWSDWLY